LYLSVAQKCNAAGPSVIKLLSNTQTTKQNKPQPTNTQHTNKKKNPTKKQRNHTQTTKKTISRT